MQKRKRILGAALGTMLGLGLLFSPYVKLSTVYGANVPVAINETNFPDAVFRQYVNDNFDTDGNGELSVSEIESVTDVFVSKMAICDLTGIENFTNLEHLQCDNNRLSSLDVSQNTALIQLWCGANMLSSLDVSRNQALKELSCNNNHLSSLDVSQNVALISLACQYNQLSSLDVSQNTALIQLYCSGNQLSSLDVSQNPDLAVLHCEDNQLSSLDLSGNSHMDSANGYSLWCTDNQIFLPLYQSGNEFYVDLSSLPLDTGRVINPSVGSYNAENGHIEGLTLDINGSSLTYQYNIDLQNWIMEVTVNISGAPIRVTEEPSTEGTAEKPGTEGTTEKHDTAQMTEVVPTEQITTQSTQADKTSQNTPKTGDTMLPVWLAVLGLFSTVCYFAARKGNGIK